MVGSSGVRDAGLADLIRSKNYKQALKNVDKKLKKQSKDEGLWTIKADLLIKNGDIDDCNALCTRLLQEVSDVEAVTRLNYVAYRLSRRSISIAPAGIEALWQRAVKNGGTQDIKIDIAERWMEECVSASQWNLAAKAAGLLIKLGSSDGKNHRRYFFWQIVAFWLSKPGPEVTDARLRTLSQSMAGRMLQKAISQTPVGEQPNTFADHSIAQRQDFELLRSIYLESDRAEQLISAIDERKLGMFSPVAVDEWGVYRAKLEAFDRLGKVDQAWDLSLSVLENAQEVNADWKADDWTYWTPLLQAQDKARQDRVRAVAKSLDQDGKGRARSPALALLAIDGVNAGNQENANRKPSASVNRKQIDDLYAKVQTHCLPIELRHQLVDRFKAQNESYGTQGDLSEVKQQSWLQKEINVFRVEYKWFLHDLSSSSTTTKQSATLLTLKNFISKCLTLYRTSRHQSAVVTVKTIPQGDEACILAVRALIQLRLLIGDSKYAVQAACLLTFLLEDSEHNSDARLMLINIHISLGLTSLAIRVYEMLDVKSLLVESCAPVLFNRISTQLPFAVDNKDHYETITRHFRFYGDALEQIPRHQVTALDKENYAQAKDFDSFSSRLQFSATRRMLATERQRVARTRQIVCNEEGMGLETSPLALARLNEAELLEAKPSTNKHVWNQTLQDKLLLSEPPLLTERSTLYQSLISDVMNLAGPDSMISPAEVKTLEALQALLARKKIEEQKLEFMTTWEICQLYVAAQISDVILKICSKSFEIQSLIESVEQLLENLRTDLDKDFDITSAEVKSSPAWPMPHWQICHKSFIQLQILTACYRLATKIESHCKNTSKPPAPMAATIKDLISSLKELAMSRSKNLKNDVASWKKVVLEQSQNNDLAERVLDMRGDYQDQVGEAIEKTLGVRNAKRIIQSFASSSITGLDGVAKVVMP